MTKTYHNSKDAFTLIELSIVLVIIGLIVGGVIGGKSLIHSAKIRQISSDVMAIQTAINTFYLQYDAIPGDMRDASDYWPNCATPTANCNGNGDGAPSSHAERYRLWQHLALADIYPNSLTGEEDGSGNCVIGINVPAAPLQGTGFMFNFHLPAWWDDALNFMIQMGKNDNLPAGNCLDAPSISPPDSIQIDKKIDDGLASTGDVRAVKGSVSGSPECLIDQGGANNNYDKSISDPSCRLFFNMKIF